MKKPLKITLIVLALLLVLVSAAAVWQRENIKALYIAYKYSSPDEISTLIEENDKIVTDALKEYNAGEMRELDEAQKKSLEEGILSEKEAIDIILGRKSGGNMPSNSGIPSFENKKNKTEVDEKIAEQIAKMYVLKAQYTSALEGLRTSIISEYNALPKNERTKASKEALGKKAIGMAANLESSCDANVNAVISELKSILSSAGRDMSLVSSVQTAYNNEKQLKKAYYINMYVK